MTRGVSLDSAVDAERVDEHLALTNPLPQRTDADRAVRIVAIGDDEERLLSIASLLGRWKRLGDGVVERGPADGVDPASAPG